MSETRTFIALGDLEGVRKRSDVLREEAGHHLCPGCGEGIVIRAIADVIEQMGVREQCVLIRGNGCYGGASMILNIDSAWSLHGRAPAMASGLRRVHPEPIIFTLQGDGDLFGEGVLEAVQAAARGERITIVCVNNGLNAETGSQMTPASIPGQRTNTTVDGRDVEQHGHTLQMAELLAGVAGSIFVARGSVHSPVEVKRTMGYLRTAFASQRSGGFSYVEILTMCPSGWHMDPVQALDYQRDEMAKYHPLGVVKGKVIASTVG